MNELLYNVPGEFFNIINIISSIISVVSFLGGFFLKNNSDELKNKIKKIFVWFCCITGVIILVLSIICATVKNNLVQMPNVINITYINAIQTLNENGIKYTTNELVNNDDYEWKVKGQSVSPGTIIFKDNSVLLTLCKINYNDSSIYNNPSITENNGIISYGDSSINIQGIDNSIININDMTSISKKDDNDNWSIELLNSIENSIQIGDNLILDLAINTPKSQYSTPYILYAAYFDKTIGTRGDWCQYFALKIPDEQSHVKLTIDTYMLGLSANEYIFVFGLFRSDDYSYGNSCASTFKHIKLIGENQTFNDDVFYRQNVVKYEFLDYYIIQGKEYLNDTKKLSLNNVSNMDIKVIAYLSDLTELNIVGSDITNIDPLRRLAKLECLSVHSNNLSDISAIEDMPYLVQLSIGGENYNGMGTHSILEDISPIKNLKLLTHLTIYDCNVKDISYIENLKLLEYVSIFKTKVSDISVLKDMRFIKQLKLHSNQIDDITPLDNLLDLTRLTISYNNLSEAQIDSFKENHPNCKVS